MHDLNDQPSFLLAALMAVTFEYSVHSSCLATALQVNGCMSLASKCVAKTKAAAGTGTSLEAAGSYDAGYQPAGMANPAL